jgi:hypothetical protein
MPSRGKGDREVDGGPPQHQREGDEESAKREGHFGDADYTRQETMFATVDLPAGLAPQMLGRSGERSTCGAFHSTRLTVPLSGTSLVMFTVSVIVMSDKRVRRALA